MTEKQSNRSMVDDLEGILDEAPPQKEEKKEPPAEEDEWDKPGRTASEKDIEEGAFDVAKPPAANPIVQRRGLTPPRSAEPPSDDPDELFAGMLRGDKGAQQKKIEQRNARPPSATESRPAPLFGEESKDKGLGGNRRQLRDKLFGLGSSGAGKPPIPEPSIQPNPYLNVQLAESPERDTGKSGRVQTPLVPRPEMEPLQVPQGAKTQESFTPPMSFPSETNNEFGVGAGQSFIPAMSRRQKTKLLAKPSTPAERPAVTSPPIAQESVRPPSEPVENPPLSQHSSQPPPPPETKAKSHEDEEIISDDDLPLESKDSKQKPEAKKEPEALAEFNWENTAYVPTIPDKSKPHSRLPSARGSSKELPESRKSSRTPDRDRDSSKDRGSSKDHDSSKERKEPFKQEVEPVFKPEVEPAAPPPKAADTMSHVANTEPPGRDTARNDKELSREVTECNKRIQDLLATLDKMEMENARLKTENESLKRDQQFTKADDSRLAQRELDEKYRKQLEQAKDERDGELKAMQEKHEKAIKLLEQDRERAIELEKKTWEREKARLEQMHKLDMDNEEKQHQQSLAALRKQLEFENEAIKNQLQREADLNKLTGQVDTLMATMRAKLEEEMKDKTKALEERESGLEDIKRKLENERVKLEVEKKRVEDLDHVFKEKEKHIKEEMEEHKRLYEYQRASLDTQHEQLLTELAEKREQLMMDRKQLDFEKAQLEKAKRAWETQCTEERMSLSLERKLLEEQKKEFAEQSEEHNTNLSAKLVALDSKREQIAREEAELLRKQQQWNEKEMQLKRENDELQLKVEKFCYEKRQLDEEKERVQATAFQVNEESRVIYKYKATIDKTRQELEQMRAEIDTKESQLRTERAKVEEAKKEHFLKQKALETVKLQYMKEQTLGEKSRSTMQPMTTPKRVEATMKRMDEERAQRFAQVRRSVAPRPVTDSFKASDFIHELERDFGKQPKFMDYIVGEKNLLLKSKQDLGEKMAQSTLLSHSQQRYQASDRKENLVSSLLGKGMTDAPIHESEFKAKLDEGINKEDIGRYEVQPERKNEQFR